MNEQIYKNKHSRLKPVPILDQAALELIHARAKAEHRSRSNAAAITVIERLSGKENNTLETEKKQENFGKV